MQYVAMLLLALGVLYSTVLLSPVDMEREEIKTQAKWFWQNLEKNVKNPKKSVEFATEFDLEGFSREFADTELMKQYTQEHKGLPEVFNMFDTDQSGMISEEEFMEFAYKHGLSRPDILGLDTHIAFVGNGGVGRSTLLNAFIGEDAHFESGVSSVPEGLTDAPSRVTRSRKFLKENTVNVSFIDSPAVISVDESISDEIRKTLMFKLMCQGFYKIFFVLTMYSGRIIGEDMAAMQLVLNSAPIKHYGVIFNQVDEGEMEMIKTHGMELIEYLNAGMNPPTSNVYFQPLLTQLAGAQNAQFEMPKDLLTFIRDTPSTMIPRQDVKHFWFKDWEQRQLGEIQFKRGMDKLNKAKADLNNRQAEAEDWDAFLKLPYYQQVFRKATGIVPVMS